MRTSRLALLLAVLLSASLVQATDEATPAAPAPGTVALPAPRTDGNVSIEKALKERRALRDPAPTPLTVAEVGQLCWAAQRVTDANGHRTAPSAHAAYPLTLYAIAGAVEGLAPGFYRYEPGAHALRLQSAGDRRAEFVKKAASQSWVAHAPVVFVISGDPGKMAKMGERGTQFMDIEVGLAAQNLLLQATALGLGGNFVGGFRPPAARAALGLAAPEEVLAVLPVGHRP